MNNRSNNEEKSFTIAAIISVIVILFFWVLTWYCLKDKGETERGTFGDMFGGINALFSGLALAGIILTILLQRNELKLQREELRDTRLEFEEQNKTLKLQRFENTFFQLLGLHHSIVSEINILGMIRRDGEQIQELFTGSKCFDFLYRKLGDLIDPTRYDEKGTKLMYEDLNLEETKNQYLRIYERYEDELSHYFRSLYQTIQFVNNSDVENKSFYTSILRAQLSPYEQIFLFYNSLVGNHSEKFKPLVEEYSLLEGIVAYHIFNYEHRWEFDQRAYGESAEEILVE